MRRQDETPPPEQVVSVSTMRSGTGAPCISVRFAGDAKWLRSPHVGLVVEHFQCWSALAISLGYLTRTALGPSATLPLGASIS